MCDFWREFLSSQLLGVILGAILTGGFTWFIEWRKSVGEQKHHIREKREETYLGMLKILYLLRNEALNPKNKEISQMRKNEIEEYYAPINVYASKQVKDLYNKTAKQDAVDNIDEFIQLLRKELGKKTKEYQHD